MEDGSDFHLIFLWLQVHHELAKYHEIGRFALDGDEKKIDWQSALFHEEHAANLGIPEAIITMAKIYLHLPHDVLVSCEVGVCPLFVLSPRKSSFGSVRDGKFCYWDATTLFLPLIIIIIRV